MDIQQETLCSIHLFSPVSAEHHNYDILAEFEAVDVGVRVETKVAYPTSDNWEVRQMLGRGYPNAVLVVVVQHATEMGRRQTDHTCRFTSTTGYHDQVRFQVEHTIRSAARL
jgi:hypothetical protein